MKLTGETKMVLTLGGIIVLLILAMMMVNHLQKTGPGPDSLPTPTPMPAISAQHIDEIFARSRHTKKVAGASLTIVEFGDFQCPSCRRAFNNTLAKGEASLAPHDFGFFHLPLPMHERAVPAAVASEAAARQDKFWPMYEALYATESEGLDDDKIQAAAKTAGLDLARFDKDRKDYKGLKAQVDADMKVSNAEAIDTTPTFLIHDKQNNVMVLAGAGNLERAFPDLKDGVIGNDAIAPLPADAKGSPITLTVNGTTSQK